LFTKINKSIYNISTLLFINLYNKY